MSTSMSVRYLDVLAREFEAFVLFLNLPLGHIGIDYDIANGSLFFHASLPPVR